MTVRELIEELQSWPADSKVVLDQPIFSANALKRAAIEIIIYRPHERSPYDPLVSISQYGQRVILSAKAH